MANTIVTMTSPDGATLNTAGTYCEGDIEVIPKLQSKTATTGEIVTADAGYVGLESVDTTGVVEAGMRELLDVFWENAQRFGKRIDYTNAFLGFIDELFFPKYDFIVSSAPRMFHYAKIKNLKERLETIGIAFDTSSCNFFTQIMQDSEIEIAPFLDMSKSANSAYAFQSGWISSIQIKSSETSELTNAFIYAHRLTTLMVDGVIGKNGFNTSWSPLDKASLVSIVNALSSTTTGLTVTLRLAAVNTAFETSTGAADGSTSEEWTALIATKSNWTINLINS